MSLTWPRTPTCSSWQAMITRCYNTKHVAYPRYGGSGITVCDRWRCSFASFLSDMGVRPAGKTLDRKNNSLGYDADNCVWSTPKEQANNRKNNHRYEHAGEFLTLREWASKLNTTHGTLGFRLQRGWSIERTLSEPVQRKPVYYERLPIMQL